MAKIKIRRGAEGNLNSITLDDGELALTYNSSTGEYKLFAGMSSQKITLINSSAAGDMVKSIYDTDNDGVVDAAESVGGLKLWKGTQAQFDAIVTKDESTIYYVTQSDVEKSCHVYAGTYRVGGYF